VAVNAKTPRNDRCCKKSITAPVIGQARTKYFYFYDQEGSLKESQDHGGEERVACKMWGWVFAAMGRVQGHRTIWDGSGHQ